MPAVRVYIEACSPTRKPDGLYDTFVAVTETEFASGEHLRVASRRAAILGYAGPHRVREVRRIDAIGIVDQHGPTVPNGRSLEGVRASQADRLAQLLGAAEAETVDQCRDVVRASDPVTRRPARISARLARTRAT